VIFVLATTDAAKLPPTVLSRCQRFDFRRISVADIRASLSDICAAEGIEAEPAALEVLARAADGSSRDSQSLLDQAIAFCGSAITLAAVRSMLGLASADAIDRLAAALLAGDARTGLELINEATDAGVDPRGLNRELVEHLRSLLLLKVSSDTAATLDVAPEALPALREQAATLSAATLVRQIKIFSEADYGFRSTLQAQLPLELAFLQAIDVGASSPAAASPAPPSPAAAGEGRGEGTRAPGRVAPAAVEDHPHPSPLPPAGEGTQADRPLPPAGEETPLAMAEAKAEWQPPTAPAAAGGLDTITQGWPAILQAVGARSKNVQALLRDCTPAELDGGTVTLACPEFHSRELQKPENKRMVEEAMSSVTGAPCYVKCVVRDRKPSAPKAPSTDQPEAAKPDENDPLLQAALRMLNNRVLEKN
jgi:DNA polymerase-3 subunit gamma/tau